MLRTAVRAHATGPEPGYSYLPKLSLADVVRPHTERLARALGTSVSVAVLDGADVGYAHRVNTPSALTVAIRVGSRIPAHRMGRAGYCIEPRACDLRPLYAHLNA